MAAMNIDNMKMTKTPNRIGVDEILILSSDEEDNEDVQGLLSAFVTSIERYVDEEVVVLLLTKFDEASTEFVTSSGFKETLKRSTRGTTRENAFIHTGKICHQLLKNKSSVVVETSKPGSLKRSKTVTKAATDSDTVTIENSENEESRKTAGKFENGTTDTPKIEEQYVENADDDDVVVIVPVHVTTSENNQATISGEKHASLKEKSKKKLKKSRKEKTSESDGRGRDEQNQKLPGSPRKRRRLVKVLEQKLKHIDERIKILNQAELSLEEMEFCDSTYIQESRLKEQFNQIWNKICRLQGRPPETGRVVEKSIKCKSTGYPEIDRAVSRFLKKTTGFPDVFDIRNVITTATKKHNLKIPPQLEQELIEEVFTDVGNKLQKRRKKDFEFNFGCELTDACPSSKDPAMHDISLRHQLENNNKKGKRAMNKVFEKYVHINRLRQHKMENSSSSEADDEKKNKSKKVKEPHSSSEDDSDYLHESHSEDEHMQENDDFEVQLNESQEVSDPATKFKPSSSCVDTNVRTELPTVHLDSDDELSDACVYVGRYSPRAQYVNGEENSCKNQDNTIDIETPEITSTCNKTVISTLPSVESTELPEKAQKDTGTTEISTSRTSECVQVSGKEIALRVEPCALDSIDKETSIDEEHSKDCISSGSELEENPCASENSLTESIKFEESTSSIAEMQTKLSGRSKVPWTKLLSLDSRKGKCSTTTAATSSMSSLSNSNTAVSHKRAASLSPLPYESPLKVFRPKSLSFAKDAASDSTENGREQTNGPSPSNGHTDTSVSCPMSRSGPMTASESSSSPSRNSVEQSKLMLKTRKKIAKPKPAESVVIIIDDD